ncbi:MAG: ferritin [Ignavibacteriaceae bacterium]
MLNEKIQKALNQQLNLELSSSYEYLAMSAFFESLNFTGFASWMRIQSQEETGHGNKIYDYILQTGGKIELAQINAPSLQYKTPKDVFEATYKHEQKVTASIHNLVGLAIDAKDYATNNFLQWFVNEQVEEEANASKILERIKMIEDSKGGLLYLDKELGKRAKSA